MKKKIIRPIIIIIIMLISISGCVLTNAEYSELDAFFAISNDELLAKQDAAHQMAECARQLGYAEDHEIIQVAKMEWENTNAILQQREQFWLQRYQEYPNATYVWLFLTNTLGYNDYVAAGIIGNMMVECGGKTLNLQYWLYSYGSGYYYGLCQWNKKSYPSVRGTDLYTQCVFLADTIKYELDTYGYAYAKGYKYTNFLQLQNEKEAALMFAKAYERCGGGYKARKDCATTAYNYFTSGVN